MADLLLPEPLDKNGFNPKAKIPFGVTTDHIRASMQDFIEFLSLIDTQLHAKKMGRLENIGPEQPKAGTMPGNDRLWPDDGQGRAPVVPDAG